MEYQGSQLISLHMCSICGCRFGVPYKFSRNWRYVIPVRRKGKLRYLRVCSYGCQQKGMTAFDAEENHKQIRKIKENE